VVNGHQGKGAHVAEQAMEMYSSLPSSWQGSTLPANPTALGNALPTTLRNNSG